MPKEEVSDQISAEKVGRTYPNDPECAVVVNGIVFVSNSDGDTSRLPVERKDEASADGMIDHLCAADQSSIERWYKRLGQYLISCDKTFSRLHIGRNCQSLRLETFPEGYKLFVHKKGSTNNPRKDLYLYGSSSKRCKKFRSPEEFALHLMWLAHGQPRDRNRDNDTHCLCRYCSNNSQRAITKLLRESINRKASKVSKPRLSENVSPGNHLGGSGLNGDDGAWSSPATAAAWASRTKPASQPGGYGTSIVVPELQPINFVNPFMNMYAQFVNLMNSGCLGGMPNVFNPQLLATAVQHLQLPQLEQQQQQPLNFASFANLLIWLHMQRVNLASLGYLGGISNMFHPQLVASTPQRIQLSHQEEELQQQQYEFQFLNSASLSSSPWSPGYFGTIPSLPQILEPQCPQLPLQEQETER